MDTFIALPIAEQRLLLGEAAKRHGRMSAQVLEKDLWVCWMLKQLFAMDIFASHLTFKGGTSLSKAYGLIERFSEDIDLTISKEYLGIKAEDYPQDVSSRKARQELRKLVDKTGAKMIAEQLLPALEKQLSTLLQTDDWNISLDESDPLTIIFQYPRVINYGTAGSEFGYIKPAIRLEFGARGDNFPTNSISFVPYAAEILPEIFDNAAGINVNVTTLEAERTFWEKVTILHDLYHKDKPLKQAIARHYYDIAMLAKKGIAAKAIKRRDILEAVVKNSRLNCTDSNDSSTYQAYEKLLQYGIRLVPPPSCIADLQRDYAEMQESGMFFGDVPSFSEIVEQLKELGHKCNQV